MYPDQMASSEVDLDLQYFQNMINPGSARQGISCF